MGYGTGAIMAVPCGDQRDFEFACAFGLSIPAIQQPPSDWFAERNIEPTLDTSMWPEAFVGNAPYVNSANDSLDLNGISSVSEAVATTNRWLEEHERGEATINYKLATGSLVVSATGGTLPRRIRRTRQRTHPS